MNIHEYQAKQLLAKYGVAVPLEIPAKSLAEVRPAAEKIAASGSARVVVKSQIHAGGRGKGTFKSGFWYRRCCWRPPRRSRKNFTWRCCWTGPIRGR